MVLEKVKIKQTDCQTPFSGGGSIIYNLCLLFMCEYLHFSQIMLNTHTHTHTHTSRARARVYKVLQ
jgi:hypothetical protein